MTQQEKNSMKKARQPVPLDIKVFIISGLMIPGIFLFPEEPIYPVFFTTYVMFIFVSVAISAFFMTWMSESEYNFFRTAETWKVKTITIVIYVVICLFIAYVLAITEWFLLFW